MENILTIKERILSFLESKGIRKVDFFEASGIQSSNFKGKNMSSQPGGDMLVKVLTLYPDLSAEWLMRGEGSMIKEQTIEQTSIPNQDISDIPSILLDKFLTTIQDQAEEIGQLRERITRLEFEKEKGASDALYSSNAMIG